MTSINGYFNLLLFKRIEVYYSCKELLSANIMLYRLSPSAQTVQITLIDIYTTFSDGHLRD